MGGLATQERAFPDGQVNVWGGCALKPAERAFGRLGAAFLDSVSRLVDVRIVWLKNPERIGEIALHAGLELAALRMGLRPRLTRYCLPSVSHWVSVRTLHSFEAWRSVFLTRPIQVHRGWISCRRSRDLKRFASSRLVRALQPSTLIRIHHSSR